MNYLATELGHPEEKERVLKIWRAVMHTIRDRIHLGESFQVIAALPMILKGIYVEDSLRKFLDERQLEHLKDQLPKEIKKLVK